MIKRRLGKDGPEVSTLGLTPIYNKSDPEKVASTPQPFGKRRGILLRRCKRSFIKVAMAVVAIAWVSDFFNQYEPFALN